jgi:alkylhydroperoxidase family enzyme
MNMTNYPVQTMETAPAGSKPALEQFQKVFGMVPNIVGAIANSPKLVTALMRVFEQAHSGTLAETEVQIVLLTDAVTNASAYAVAFHTAMGQQAGLSAEVTDAIREGRAPKDKRYAALSLLAKTLIEKRGHLSDQEQESFFAAGFTREQVLEVILTVAASTMTNYTGTLANPQLEPQFQPFAWRAQRAAS